MATTEQRVNPGIAPISAHLREIGRIDNFVLWADFGISFLVMLVGTLIGPALGLAMTLVAILVGAVIGNGLLGVIAAIGQRVGVPTMVLLRPALGIRGSYIPSAVNVFQLIGWATFEIVIMALAADGISQTLFGFSNPVLWAVVFAAISTLMAVYGPKTVVKQWMEKFAVWIVLGTTIWLSYQIVSSAGLRHLFETPAQGGMSFWLAVDLVVAMPISWLPLAADYSRFVRSSRSAFWGTGLGYAISHAWFYALGAVLALSAAVSTPSDLFAHIGQLVGGWLVLLIILVDEVDEGFSDIYSAIVSSHNVLSRVGHKTLAVIIGVICAVAASWLILGQAPLLQYESFLLLIGAVFVPLMGVLIADYFVVRGRRYDTGQIFSPGGAYWHTSGFNLPALVVWIIGFITYLVISGVPPLGVSGAAPWLGATLPSLAVSFVLYALLGRTPLGESGAVRRKPKRAKGVDG